MLFCLQQWGTNCFAGRHADLLAIGAAQLAAWYVWAGLTPALFGLAERARPAWPPSGRVTAVHFAAWLVCHGLHTLVLAAMATILDPVGTRDFLIAWRVAAVSWVPSTFLLYCATIGASALLRARERERVQAKARAELNEAMVNAELAALRSQLHPHFLFNALNTVAVLVRARNVEAAERVVTQLGDILRDILRSTSSHETTLANELELVRRYVEIEQIRFGTRLRVRWAVPEACLGARVPMLLLQPLVENAVRHGIARLEAGGVIEISAWVAGSRLGIRVVNDGTHPPASPTVRRGVGLANTRRRLEQMYGTDARLVMVHVGERTTVEVEMPYRLQALTDGDRAASDRVPVERRG